ncbi:MAG: TIGR03752 family integrating conjugative element protein [Gammaproteobacteria bacterium]|nr:TIGR03752 family integrating conjugative element protein [Gammaproteobacteria bacterium]
MPWNINNKLLPIVAVVVLLGMFFVFVNSCGTEDGAPTLLDSVPASPEPDADSPADTIKTLTANVSELISEVDALRKDNADLHEARSDLETSFSNKIASKISEYHQSQNGAGRRAENELRELFDQIDSLKSQIDDYQLESTGSRIPLDDGFDGLSYGVGSTETMPFVWIDPIDSSLQGREFSDVPGVPPVRPVYTIPRNATLIGSTAMTALVGRVPFQGQVRDPMPFKVLTGRENIAANGLMIDGIEGMVWSGYAVGDWTLGCVSGKLETVTFVFEDGTIRTVGNSDTGGSGSNSSIGWISDGYGMPCIAGQRKTNAMTFLAQQASLNATQAAADAASSLETTQALNVLGGISSIVNGDTGKYILGKTVAGGAQATASWLAQRASQEIDAVYVAAGQQVAIHIDSEIRIDYEKGGRQLNHEHAFDSLVVPDFD